jgi:hypothetical protein
MDFAFQILNLGAIGVSWLIYMIKNKSFCSYSTFKKQIIQKMIQNKNDRINNKNKKQ